MVKTLSFFKIIITNMIHTFDYISRFCLFWRPVNYKVLVKIWFLHLILVMHFLPTYKLRSKARGWSGLRYHATKSTPRTYNYYWKGVQYGSNKIIKKMYTNISKTNKTSQDVFFQLSLVNKSLIWYFTTYFETFMYVENILSKRIGKITLVF